MVCLHLVSYYFVRMNYLRVLPIPRLQFPRKSEILQKDERDNHYKVNPVAFSSNTCMILKLPFKSLLLLKSEELTLYVILIFQKYPRQHANFTANHCPKKHENSATPKKDCHCSRRSNQIIVREGAKKTPWGRRRQYYMIQKKFQENTYHFIYSIQSFVSPIKPFKRKRSLNQSRMFLRHLRITC